MANLIQLSNLTPAERKRKIAELSADPTSRARIPLRYLPAQYRAARVARLQQNPGSRVKLDDKYLTPAQRAQRATAQRLAAPIMPGSGTTMGYVEDMARADVNAEYAQPESELRGAIGQSQRMSRAIPGWYDAYRDQVKQAADRTAAMNQQITQALMQGAAQTQENAGQAAQQQADQMQADAASRGATVSPDVVNRALAAARSGAEMQNLITAGNAQAQNAQTQYLNSGVANADLAKLEALGRERSNLTGLLGEERTLAAKKGAALTARKGDILNRERTSELEQRAFDLNATKTAAQIALDRQKARQAQTDAALDRKIKMREIALRQAGLDADTAHNKAMEDIAREGNTIKQQNADTATTKATQKDGTKPVKEAADNRKYRANITGNLAGRIKRDAQSRGLNLKDAKARRQYVAVLRKGNSTKDWFSTPYGHALVTAALDYAALGRISANTVRQLRNMGLVITTKGSYGGPGAKG